MAEIMQNRMVFANEPNWVYCYNCKTEMSFNGHGYECPVCGSMYLDRGD